MADIKQAARWLKEGHLVLRRNRADRRLELYRGFILNSNSWSLTLSTDGLLADDWEIAE